MFQKQIVAGDEAGIGEYSNLLLFTQNSAPGWHRFTPVADRYDEFGIGSIQSLPVCEIGSTRQNRDAVVAMTHRAVGLINVAGIVQGRKIRFRGAAISCTRQTDAAQPDERECHPPAGPTQREASVRHRCHSARFRLSRPDPVTKVGPQRSDGPHF